MWPALGKASVHLGLKREALGEGAAVSVRAQRLLAPAPGVLRGPEAANVSGSSTGSKAQPQPLPGRERGSSCPA